MYNTGTKQARYGVSEVRLKKKDIYIHCDTSKLFKTFRGAALYFDAVRFGAVLTNRTAPCDDAWNKTAPHCTLGLS